MSQRGDLNTNFFHYVVQARRNVLTIHRVKSHNHYWVEGKENIEAAFVTHFQNQLNVEPTCHDLSILDVIPNLISEDMNTALTDMPIESGILKEVKDLNANSCPGQDQKGLGVFFTSHVRRLLNHT